jgi:hypothetical protein
MRSNIKLPHTVAFCTNAVAFSDNQILRRETAEKYPGALWIPELADMLNRWGISTVTGDVALSQLRSGELSPTEVSLIQEDRSNDGDELLRHGAKGKVLLCCESPLFAADFYKNLPTISAKFDHSLIFRGAIKDASPLVGSHVLYFPSFDSTNLFSSKSWGNKKHLVMVAGNKYWKIRRSPIRNLAAKIRNLVIRSPERFSGAYGSLQLHDQRLEAIFQFGRKGGLDLYGSGWSNLTNLPSNWQKKLSSIVSNLNPVPCSDKLATIASYKFALCFENIEFPGYITEKMIDCLVAGVVPVYWGAPDIQEFVPQGCFIDSRKYESLEELDRHLSGISENEWRRIVSCGNDFLKSEIGKRYSYRGFAERMQAMLIE